MDNAPYHSRRIERLPTSAWRKADLQTWLTEKHIAFRDTMVRSELLTLARAHKDRYFKYAVDEMAR